MKPVRPIIIQQNRDISKHLQQISFAYNKSIFVFDIHKTTLTKDGKADKEVLYYIQHLKTNHYNICFLSYDGNITRVYENNALLNKIKEYRDIPRVFITKRRKQLVIKELLKSVMFDKRLSYHVVLIDDNENNIKDTNQLHLPHVLTYYFTKHNQYNGHSSLSGLKRDFNVLKSIVFQA